MPDMYNTVEQPINLTGVVANTANFTLRGGSYGVTVTATVFGTITLQKLAPDNTTFITVLTAFAAAGYASVNLPSGTYRFTVAGITAGQINITSIVTTM